VVQIIKAKEQSIVTGYSYNSRTEVSQSYGVQRTVPRYSVLAVAELNDAASTMCIVGRMKEISRKGCYVNTPSTLPVNTLLRVVITRDDETFVTNGKILYAHDKIGMGVGFIEPAEDQVEILNSWLAGASRAEGL
jgi:hypothetical protein